MRRTRGRDANMRFLFGSVFFFFIIIVVIMLFGYLSIRQSWNMDKNRGEMYSIAFSKQFEGLNYELYLNDSLLYHGNPINPDTLINISRFAKENALLVVESESQQVTILEIGKHGNILICFDRNGDVTADITE